MARAWQRRRWSSVNPWGWSRSKRRGEIHCSALTRSNEPYVVESTLEEGELFWHRAPATRRHPAAPVLLQAPRATASLCGVSIHVGSRCSGSLLRPQRERRQRRRGACGRTLPGTEDRDHSHQWLSLGGGASLAVASFISCLTFVCCRRVWCACRPVCVCVGCVVGVVGVRVFAFKLCLSIAGV